MEYISLGWKDIHRDCGSYHVFRYRGLLLTRKLLNQRFLVVKLKSSLQKFTVTTITYGVSVSQRPRICSVCRNPKTVLVPFMTYHRVCNKDNTRRVPHVEQEVLVLPERLASHTVVSGVRVGQSLVFCVIVF